MKTIEERLDRIEQILKDNKQHERICPAHLTASDMSTPFGGMFTSQREASCDCWISQANPSLDPTTGYGIYEKDIQTLWQSIFPSRYDAVEYLVAVDTVTRDPKADNYWGKQYLIIEVAAKKKEDTLND